MTPTKAPVKRCAGARSPSRGQQRPAGERKGGGGWDKESSGTTASRQEASLTTEALADEALRKSERLLEELGQLGFDASDGDGEPLLPLEGSSGGSTCTGPPSSRGDPDTDLGDATSEDEACSWRGAAWPPAPGSAAVAERVGVHMDTLRQLLMLRDCIQELRERRDSTRAGEARARLELRFRQVVAVQQKVAAAAAVAAGQGEARSPPLLRPERSPPPQNRTVPALEQHASWPSQWRAMSPPAMPPPPPPEVLLRRGRSPEQQLRRQQQQQKQKDQQQRAMAAVAAAVKEVPTAVRAAAFAADAALAAARASSPAASPVAAPRGGAGASVGRPTSPPAGQRLFHQQVAVTRVYDCWTLLREEQ